MENLKRIREPLAWAMVAVAVAGLAVTVARMVWIAGDIINNGAGGADVVMVISYSMAGQSIDYPLTVALAIAVWGCAVAPPVPRARTIALLAAWIATLTVALPWLGAAISVVMLPAGGPPPPWEWWAISSLLYPLVSTGVAAAATAAIWALARPPSEDATEPEERDEETPAALEAEEPQDQPEPLDENPTVWKPAEATGTVWRTADEAAAGAPGAQFFDPTAPAQAAERPQPASGKEHDWRPPAGQ